MIALEGLSRSFAGRPALRGLSLSVPQGCLYGLVGPGAAGKTLALKIICGLLKPDSGRVWVNGRDITRLGSGELDAHRQGIGMQFQNNALFDFMNVAENIAFPLQRFQLSASDITARVAERLSSVALHGFQERMPNSLSGGQKKRVGIARATIADAPIVLYDEPAAGLDPVTSLRIFELLRTEQRKRQSTVILVSSDLDRLLAVTDRVGVMHEGQLVFEGSTDEARSSDHPVVRQFLHGLLEGPL